MCWGPLGQLTTDLEPSGPCVSHDRLMPTSPVPLTPQRFFRLLYLRHLWATDLMGLVLPRTPECPSREVHRPSLKDVRPLLSARPPRYRSSRVPIKLFQSSPRGSHSALFTSAANHPVASGPLSLLGLPRAGRRRSYVGTGYTLAHRETRTPAAADPRATETPPHLLSRLPAPPLGWADTKAAQKTRGGFAPLHPRAGVGSVISGLQ